MSSKAFQKGRTGGAQMTVLGQPGPPRPMVVMKSRQLLTPPLPKLGEEAASWIPGVLRGQQVDPGWSSGLE
jgi:hypothetical protein